MCITSCSILKKALTFKGVPKWALAIIIDKFVTPHQAELTWGNQAPDWWPQVIAANDTRERAARLKFMRSTAAELHEMQKKSRKHMSDGTFEPHLKTIDGVMIDIANMHYNDLPVSLQNSNLEAARCACRNVEREFTAGRDIHDRAFLEKASELQHKNWIRFNNSWADAQQLVKVRPCARKRGPRANESKEEKRRIHPSPAPVSPSHSRLHMTPPPSPVPQTIARRQGKRPRNCSSGDCPECKLQD